MIGDVYLLEQKHKDVAKSVVDHVSEDHKGIENVNKFVIAISGKSGSGKSEAAHEISLEFKRRGKTAKVVGVDNFYRIHPKHREEWRQEQGIEDSVGLNEVDWDKMTAVVEKFKSDDICQMPIVDKHSDQIDNLETDFKGVDVLIIEGLYAANVDKADLKIMVETTWDIMVEAQKRRGKEELDEHRMNVLMQENAVVDNLMNNVDLIILAEDYSLKRFAEYMDKKMKEEKSN